MAGDWIERRAVLSFLTGVAFALKPVAQFLLVFRRQVHVGFAGAGDGVLNQGFPNLIGGWRCIGVQTDASVFCPVDDVLNGVSSTGISFSLS